MIKTSLEGKAGIVTGGGAGIGESCAKLLAEMGASILVSDINIEAAELVAGDIENNGGRAIANACDVGNFDDVADMVKAAQQAFGKLDFAVNNAGILGYQIPLHKYTVEQWQRVNNINLSGVFYCMNQQLGVFYQQGHGVIVNIASEASLKGSAADSAYTAAKHGVAGLTKTAALEAAPKGIRVNAVCPGSIKTLQVSQFIENNPQLEEHGKNLMPIGRWGAPDEIAQSVAWLCSDAASLVTGSIMTVDGGWSVS